MANRDFFRRLGLADEVAAPTLARLRQPKTLRRLLLALGPIVVLAGGLFAYTSGGRYVSTDNAYVHAGKLTVATDVSGIVADVAVKESQKVEKGQVLFTLDQEPFRIALAGAEANLGIVRNQLVTMLDRGEQLDWFSATEIWIEAVLAALAFYLFLVQTLTLKSAGGKQPFIDPAIFRDRNFTVGLCFIFVVGIILLASLALITPYLQNLMGYPVVTAGLVLAPRGVGTMVAMMIVGRLINGVDPRVLLASGLLLTAAVLWEMTGFTPDVSEWTLIRTGILQGLGLGFMFVPLSTITFATLPGSLRTQGTALYSLVRNLGSSIGISLVIFLLTRNTQLVHAELAGRATPYNDALSALAPGRIWDMATTLGKAALNAEVTKQAAVVAYANDFQLMMVVALVALPLIFLLKRAKVQPGAAAVLE